MALSQEVAEYAVKAAFVYDFAKFVTWPTGAFKSEDSPITICVLGQNPFGNSLSQIIAGKTLNGRGFALRHIMAAEAARGCQIIFISRSERKQLGSILAGLRTSSILTVGDTEGFAERGVMINLFLEDNRVHFEINPAAAARTRIRISSRLLSLAKIVKE